MKTKTHANSFRGVLRRFGGLGLATVLLALPAFGQGTAFTYQGRLNDGAGPANGSYDLGFALFNAESGGTQQGAARTNLATAVSNGLFTVTLDFGNQFPGADRWLEIGVRTNDGGAFTVLIPRQQLLATPYAVFAAGVKASGISGAIPPGSIGAGSITSNMLAAGSVTVVQLTPGTVAANLAASGLGAVGSGGIVLSEDASSTALQNAGYLKLDGSINVPDKWIDGALTPAGPAAPLGTHLIIGWTGTEMLLSGWAQGQAADGGFYNPGADAWLVINTNGAPLAAQVGVWTGTELLVAASVQEPVSQFRFAGGKYHRGTGTWTTISPTNAPQSIGSAVWTGSRMIVWGGIMHDNSTRTNTGAVYDPVANTWTPMTTVNAPAARSGHTVIWTGTRMLVWGGTDGATTLDSGGSYDPVADIWTPLSLVNAPAARIGHTAIWTGSRMIVYGGATNITNLQDFTTDTGASYDSATDTWTAIPNSGTDSERVQHSAVWTGSEMLVFGGWRQDFGFLPSFYARASCFHPGSNAWLFVESVPVGTGSGTGPFGRINHGAVWTGSEMLTGGGVDWPVRYDPATGRYRDGFGTPALNPARHKAVWTGQEMISWGGGSSLGIASRRGFRFNPSTGSWGRTSETNAPSHRQHHSVVWTGTELIVWGGYDENSADALNTGARYNPVTDTWTPVSTNGAPKARFDHTATWSGTEMVVWGGENVADPFAGSFSSLATGARYNPVLDAWMPMTTNAAPVARALHSAVWSGSELIVWGGVNIVSNLSIALNSGARYHPAGDAWTALALPNAPAARQRHTAVWAGDRMVVWGGDVTGSALDTGASYSVTNDSWAALPTLNAPAARFNHGAVWTGEEMVVWGGTSPAGILNSGGVFNPIENTWTTTTTLGSPSARTEHTAVWSGTQMWVFGGVRLPNDATPIRSHGYFPPRTLYLWLSQNSGSYTNTITIVNVTNTYVGPFAGSGAGLTNLNPANLLSGTAAINITGNAAGATSFFGPLNGDVTGTQSATVVASVGGQSAANLAAAANSANAATPLNTPNAIVRRDASGNFSAGAITATSFAGNGSGLTGLNPASLNPGTANINISGIASSAALAATANSLSGLLTVTGGGTGAGTAAGARTNLGAASRGTNSDIVSLTGLTTPLSLAQGGTGAGTVTEVLSNLGAASLGGSNTFAGINMMTNPANVFNGSVSGNGAGLTNLNIGAFTTGTLSDARIGTNVARLNVNQTFTGLVTMNHPSNQLAGLFAGDGAGLTGVNLSRMNTLGAIQFVTNTPVAFGQGLSIFVGVNPLEVAAADFNMDGRMDLAVANATSGGVSILTNTGSGQLEVQSLLNIASPGTVAVADFNQDGKPDVVASGRLSRTVIIWTNSGTGNLQQFASQVANATGSIEALDVADLNADGKVDVVVANQDSDSLTVLTNTGAGLLNSEVLSVGDRPLDVIAADVNGDLRLDLVSANGFSANLSVLTNNGSGAFTLMQSPVVGSSPSSLAAGDLNGDGKLELVSADSNAGRLSVLTNNGTGPFALAFTLPFGVTASPNCVRISDLNRDGRPDLVTANFGSSLASIIHSIWCFTNNGGGTFSPPLERLSGQSGKFDVADFTGDAIPDLAVPLFGATAFDLGTVEVLPSLVSYQARFAGNGANLTNLNPAALMPGTAAINITGNAATATTAGSAGTATTSGTATNFSGTLAGDVTGAQSATVVANVGAQTAANVANATVLANTATAVNTPNTLVRRDASGNFTAGAITAVSFSGSGSNLTALNAGSISSGVLAASLIDSTMAADSEIVPTVLANDGPGSGLDADFLDGLNSTAFALASHTHDAAAISSGILPLVRGGTGTNSAAGALANLGGASLASSNTFTGVNTMTNPANSFVGAFSGNGASLTNLNPGSLAAGTAAINISGNAASATSATTATTANSFTGSLAGDVTGTQGATVVASISGQTAANVAGGASLANAATANNTANTLVRRDASGDFSANAITAASITGNGAALANLNAANIASGILPIARGGTGTNTPSGALANLGGISLAGSNVVSGVNAFTNSANVFVGAFHGNGGGLSNLPATGLVGAINAANIAAGSITSNLLAPGSVGTAQLISGTTFSGTFVGSGMGMTNVNLFNLNAGPAISFTSDSLAKWGYVTLPGAGPIQAAIADLNGDSWGDLVTCSNAGVMSFTNRGDGTFTASSAGVIRQNLGLLFAVGDLNADTLPDLVVGTTSSTVSIHANDGAGGFFQSVTDIEVVPGVPNCITVGDLNNDSRPDIVVGTTSGTLSILTNQSPASLFISSPTNIALPANPVEVDLADVNLDGRLDLIAVLLDNTLQIRTNGGNLDFTLSQSVALGDLPRFLRCADVNGDGFPDAVCAFLGAGQVSTFTNNGVGSLALAGTVTLSPGVDSFAILDLNNDGRPDLAVANQSANTLLVLTNGGAGQFALAAANPTGIGPTWVGAGDANHDGRPDVIIAEVGSATATVYIQTSSAKFTGTFAGDGSLLAGVVPATGSVGAAQLADNTITSAKVAELDAAKIASGTLSDARLSANVALLDRSPQIFAGVNVFQNSVGIGTASPGTYPFRVNGNVRLGNRLTGGRSGAQYDEIGYNIGFTTTNDTYTYLDGDSAASIRLGNGGDVEFRTAPTGGAGASLTLSNRMILKQTGNVGIGESAPEAPLHVAEGSAGVVTASGSAIAVFERSGQGYLSLLTPAANDSGILFGSPTHIADGGVLFNANAPRGLEFRAGGNSLKMVILANGNVGIGTNAPQQKLHVIGNILASGTITPNSDRNLKTDFAPVDTAAVLEKVAGLSIQQWRFKAEGTEVKHFGPMAQDFRSAFGLGEIPTAIATVDADGVALAAIQGLNEKVESGKEKAESEIKSLKAENAELKARLERLEQLMNHRRNGGTK